MSEQRTISEWLQQRGMTLEQLVDASALEQRTVESIVAARYTTSPKQRERIAAALGVSVDQILWGHAVAVHHMYGHGPQFGRSP